MKKDPKGKYFPNNWDAVQETDYPSVPYEDIMEGKVSMWQLPSSVCCVIRVHNKETNKVEEWSYQRMSAAQKRMMQLVTDKNNEITIVDEDAIYMITDSGSDFDDLTDQLNDLLDEDNSLED